MMSRAQRKFHVLSVCSALLATFISDYEYGIEYENEFSNRIYLPPVITYQNNLIPKVWLCTSQQRERLKGIELAPRTSKVVLAPVFALAVKSEER